MQAIAIDRDALTGDMYALAAYMMRAANVAQFDIVGELELSLTQIKALHVLDNDERDRSVKAIADALGVSLPATSRAIDGLFERGLVTREEEPTDRRMKRVRLTDAGREVPHGLTAARLSALGALMRSLDDEQAAALAHALELILSGRPEIADCRAALGPAEADAAAAEKGKSR